MTGEELIDAIKRLGTEKKTVVVACSDCYAAGLNGVANVSSAESKDGDLVLEA